LFNRVRLGIVLAMRFTPLAYAAVVVTNAASALAWAPVITAAASKVSAPPEDNLFEFETLQLTPQSLARVDPRSRFLYDFGDASRAPPGDYALPPIGKCKVFPGDHNWPNPGTWNEFNQLTGGALISTVPQASPCYYGPHYNAATCATLTANWTNSYTQ
jgi:hypothetical protein